MAEVPYPSVVSRHLAQGASIGFSQGLVWCLSRTQLTAWDPQGSGAAITRRLPLQADPGLAHVALGATPSGLTALLVTPQGDSILWDAFTGQQDPFVSRVDGQVSALAAHCTARGGFVAAIGTESGHVHLLRSFPGLEPVWAPLAESAASPSQSPPGGSIFGRLSAAVYGGARRAAEVGGASGPVRSLAFAAGSSADAAVLHVAREERIEAWSLDQGAAGRGAAPCRRAWELEAAAAAARPGARIVAASPVPGGQQLVFLTDDGSLFAARAEAPGAARRLFAVPPDSEIVAAAPARAGAEGVAIALWAPQHRALSLLRCEPGRTADLAHWPSAVYAVTAGGPGWIVAGEAALSHVPVAFEPGSGAGGPVPAVAALVSPAAPAAAPAGRPKSAAADSPATVLALSELLQRACQGQLSGAELARHVAAAGCGPSALAAAALACSKDVADALPRLFQAADPSVVGHTLEAKAASHGVLLQVLTEAGLLRQLSPETIKKMLEDGQTIAALQGIRGAIAAAERDGAATSQRGVPLLAAAPPDGPGDAATPSGILRRLVEKAGWQSMSAALTSAATVALEERDPAQVFFACPTVTVLAFFQAVAWEAAQEAGALLGPGEGLLRVLEALSVAVRAGLDAARRAAAAQTAVVGNAAASVALAVEADEPLWTAGADVRGALLEIGRAQGALVAELSRAAGDDGAADGAGDGQGDVDDDRSDATSLLLKAIRADLDTVEAALDAFAAAVGARRAAPDSPLVRSYAAAKDELLTPAFAALEALWRRGEPASRAALEQVEAVAAAHSHFALLFDLAELVQDRERLYDAMQTLKDPVTGASMVVYVFERLLRDGRLRDLLELPAAFDPPLKRWLEDPAAPDPETRRRLLWAQAVRMGDHDAVARGAAALAAGAEGQTPAELGRLLALQRVAAIAGTSGRWPLECPPATETLLESTASQAALVELQAGLGLSAASVDPATALSAMLELGTVEAASAAVEAYGTVHAPAQRAACRPLVLDAWRRLAGSSDWEAQASSSVDPGTGRVVVDQALAAQPLCAAAAAMLASDVAYASQVRQALQELASGWSEAGRDCLLQAFDLAVQG